MLEVYYTSEYTDDNGEQWFSINGDTHFPLSAWTKESAIAYYTSEEGYTNNMISSMKAFGYYD